MRPTGNGSSRSQQRSQCNTTRAPVRARRARGRGVTAVVVAGLLGGCSSSPVPVASRSAGVTVTHHPMAVVMCTFADQGSNMELPASYYQALFGPGTGGIYDYFQQVSFGQASVDATVLGPFTVSSAYTAIFYPTGSGPMTLNQYMGLKRYDQILTCLGTAADAGIDLTPYQELIAQQVSHDRLAAYGNPVTSQPTVLTTLTAAASTSATTLQVQSSAGFPAPPFPAGISSPTNAHKSEEVVVTAESNGGTTWTVTRAFEGSTAQPLAVGDQIVTAFTSDIGAMLGPQTLTVGTSNQEHLNNVGLMDADPLGSPVILAQEISHGVFNMNHSRDLISPTSDYQDMWDVMSGLNCYFEAAEPAFAVQAGYTTTPEQYGWGAGPGYSAVNLDYLGWIPAAQENTTLLASSGCTSAGITLDALSQSQGDLLEARLPYVNQASFPANGAYYTVEYRNPLQAAGNTIWDSAIPRQTVLVHLAVPPSGPAPYISYLADSTVGGALVFESAQPGGVGGTPQLVPGSGFADPTSGAYVGVHGFTADGKAHVTIGTCPLPLQIQYTGAVSGDYHDAVTVSATLSTEPATGPSYPVVGKTVALAVGSDACAATTDLLGNASCTVTLTDTPGSATASASFVGTKVYGGASTSAQFTINKEQTKLVYDGPTVFVNGTPAVLSANLTEDGTTAINGGTVTFTLGGTQSCSAATGGTGQATCTIPSVNQPGGVSGIVVASFAGDADYLPAADTKSTVVGSFATALGASFVVGDETVASAPSSLTFWGADWATENALSGGAAPAAFKGFANTPNSAAPTCGGSYTTGPGNSSRPPATLPDYLALYVSTDIGKSGNTISGDIHGLVIVRTNPGYANDPGHAGTGSIVATVCSSP